MNMDTLLHQMIEKEASDLHIKVGSPPGYRIDGELKPIEGLDRITVEKSEELAREVVSPERWEEFSKSGDLDFGYSVPKLARFRVNVMKQRGSCSMVIRKIPVEIPTLDELGLPDICRALSEKPRGLVLVTGPTGSGKSTTLAAMVDHVNRTIDGHILTMEDPIEFIHADKKCYVNQREIGADTKDFQSALRRALRQDPDVILIGELRDLETISLATTAAETGHLVLGTLHTTSAMQTVDRLIDAFPHEQQSQIRTQLSLTLQGVISQTLVQKIGGGRVAAHEIMIATDAVRASIRDSKTPQLQNILTTGAKYGMITLEDSLIKLAKSGQITPENAVSYSNNPNLVRDTLGIAAGVGVGAIPGAIGQTSGQSLGPVKMEGMRQPVMPR
ncbi:MAG: type IV pilus twitching motility protein PilT [candidate division Zixibacteria bacterium]|nr:type IV pilus twitching motility protein PilT [candidate division Zixibacteria bacterium]